MSAKPDRKSMMRSSVNEEKLSVDQRFDPATTVEQRYEAAEKALDGRPMGLVGPKTDPAPAVDFSAEIAQQSIANGRQVISLPLDRVHDNPYNARQLYDATAVNALAASIATRTQLVPAPVVQHPTLPGHYLLIDGHYRKRALHAASKTHIDCVMHDQVSELDMYRMSYLINEQRNAQSPLDNALAWQKLLIEKKVEDGEAIAELTGVSTSTVARTMALLKLPESAILKLREQPAKFGVAVGYEIYRISKLMPEKELLALMHRAVTDDMSSRELEQLRIKLEEATPRKKKEVSRQYRIMANNAQIGFIKDWDNGKIAIEVNLADPREREALLEELKRRFNLSDAL